MKHPRVSFVIGWNDESTVQYEGVAAPLTEEDEHLKDVYNSTFPEGRERATTWQGLVYFKVSPSCTRYSNFADTLVIEEMHFDH